MTIKQRCTQQHFVLGLLYGRELLAGGLVLFLNHLFQSVK